MREKLAALVTLLPHPAVGADPGSRLLLVALTQVLGACGYEGNTTKRANFFPTLSFYTYSTIFSCEPFSKPSIGGGGLRGPHFPILSRIFLDCSAPEQPEMSPVADRHEIIYQLEKEDFRSTMRTVEFSAHFGLLGRTSKRTKCLISSRFLSPILMIIREVHGSKGGGYAMLRIRIAGGVQGPYRISEPHRDGGLCAGGYG